MSGIFGLIRQDGAPVDPTDLAAMRSAMGHWGPDGAAVWHGGPAALGHCLLVSTPEARHERMPRATDDGRLAASVAARIDNRDDLLDQLDVPAAARPGLPDGDLVVRAYEKWGDACAEHLLGDWACAIWDARARRLFLARDHHGNTALHYVQDERRFAFASDRKALLALPGVPRRLNELYLAQLLVAWPAYQGAGTIYLDVHRVPPAHAMVVSGGQARSWRYWRLEDVPEVRLRNVDEYADGLREQLARAVRSRLRSVKPVAMALSGGLDSGAVMALAAREARGTGPAMFALTSVPIHDTVQAPMRLVNEFDLASATARACGIDLFPVGAEHVGPIDGMKRMLDVHGEPSHAVASHYWLTALLEAARDRGAGVVLTAQNGNQVVSWNGVPSASSAWWALRHAAPALAAREALRAARLAWLRRSRGAAPRGSRETGPAPWRSYSAIHPDFAARMDLRARMAEDGYDPLRALELTHRAHDARLAAIRPGRDINGAKWAQLGAAFGLEARDPAQDVRVMTFALGIPEPCWRGPLNRWVLRHAMSGLLPDAVRLNVRVGLQAADLLPRLRAHRAECAGLLDDLEACVAARDMIDLAYMRETAERMATSNGYAVRRAAATVLMRGLGAGAFLAGWAAAGTGTPYSDTGRVPISR